MINTDNDVTDEHKASFLQYLIFIQDIITRMNRNAFQLKGWCITIIAALSALAVDKGSLLLFVVAAVSAVPFCFLDAYYLLMERQFRGLYSDVINGCADITLFSMPINRYTRKEAKSDVDKKKYSYWRIVFSRSVILFYASMSLLCLAGMLVSLKCPLSSQKESVCQKCCYKTALIDRSVPRYSELHNNDFGVRKSGEESFRWEYKWK